MEDGEERSGCGATTQMQTGVPLSTSSKGAGAEVSVMLMSPGAMVASRLSALGRWSAAARGSTSSATAS